MTSNIAKQVGSLLAFNDFIKAAQEDASFTGGLKGYGSGVLSQLGLGLAGGAGGAGIGALLGLIGKNPSLGAAIGGSLGALTGSIAGVPNMFRQTTKGYSPSSYEDYSNNDLSGARAYGRSALQGGGESFLGALPGAALGAVGTARGSVPMTTIGQLLSLLGGTAGGVHGMGQGFASSVQNQMEEER